MGKILVVEDSPRLLRLAEEAIRPLGHEVLHAPSAEKGLDVLMEHQVDLIIAEYRMSGVDGMQFLYRLRKEKITAPFVFAASFIPQQVKEAAALLGVREYIDRNYPRIQVQKMIMRVMELEHRKHEK